MRRIDLNTAERGIARLVAERCNEIMRDARASAAKGMAHAKAAADAHARRGDKAIRESLVDRDEILPEDAVKPVLDPKTLTAIAVEVSQRRRCSTCNDSGHTCSTCGAPGDGCPACDNSAER